MKHKRPQAAALEDHLGYWLRLVSNHVSQGFARKLDGRGVTVAEWVVLREMLHQPPLAPSQLAGRLGLTRGAISKLADRLIAKRLILRRAGQDDLRFQSLELTPQGAELVPELAALADQNEAECFGHLGKAERLALHEAMQALARHHSLTSKPID